MSDPLSFTFTLDPAEHVRAAGSLARRHRSWFLRWGWAVIVALPAMISLASGAPLTSLWPYGVMIFAGGLYLLLAPPLLRRQVRRQLEQTPSLREPQTYRFAETSLQMGNPLAATELGWDAVIEAVETPEFLFVYFSPKCAYYLPKRVLGRRAEDVRNFLRGRLGARAAGLSAVDATAEIAN